MRAYICPAFNQLDDWTNADKMLSVYQKCVLGIHVSLLSHACGVPEASYP